jgi:transcriptional regulator with XRE-family HTH domain
LSKKDLLNKLQDPAYRSEFVSNEVDIGLPMQLRAMREKRGWKQSFVAEQTGTKQPRFSLMEKPGYGKFSLNTLKKLATLFDVGLIVSFVPWGEMIDFVESLSRRRLEILPFNDERSRLAVTYSRARNTTGVEERQLSLCFSTGQTIVVPVERTISDYERASAINNSIQIEPELVANAYLATFILQGSGNNVSAR